MLHKDARKMHGMANSGVRGCMTIPGTSPKGNEETVKLIKILVAGCLVCSALVLAAQSPDQASAPAQAQTESATASPQIYKPGGAVSAPKLIHYVDPEYTDEARRKRLKGVTVLSLVIDAEGNPQQIKVVRALADHVAPKFRSPAEGLDQNALETVKQYHFEPSMLNGKPVAVSINIEIHYRLF